MQVNAFHTPPYIRELRLPTSKVCLSTSQLRLSTSKYPVVLRHFKLSLCRFSLLFIISFIGC